jgi:hypothetical protein
MNFERLRPSSSGRAAMVENRHIYFEEVKMEQTITVPDYEPATGLRLQWDDAFVISVVHRDKTTIVRANRPGLVSLARHLLTLAQEGVPTGRHIHLDAFNALESDSEEAIFERVERAS